MRLTNPRRPKRGPTGTAAMIVDETNEIDSNSNDVEVLSEGQPMEEDDVAPSPLPHVAPRRRDGTFAECQILKHNADKCIGKRKASTLESVESPREKKRARDDSETIEDDGANTGK